MKYTKTIILSSLTVLLIFGLVLFNSCDEEDSLVGSVGKDCPGAQAEHYRDLMNNNPYDNCQQIWAQQAAWHAYKCNCDNGLANSSDANRMVGVLNATRDNITALYKSGGSGPYTKCGSIPPEVSKCKVK